MSRHVKRNKLARIVFSVIIIILHYLDLRYVIYPNFTKVNEISTNEYLILLSFSLIFIGLIYNKITSHRIIPVNDPRLDESKHLENAL